MGRDPHFRSRWLQRTFCCFAFGVEPDHGKIARWTIGRIDATCRVFLNLLRPTCPDSLCSPRGTTTRRMMMVLLFNFCTSLIILQSSSSRSPATLCFLSKFANWSLRPSEEDGPETVSVRHPSLGMDQRTR